MGLLLVERWVNTYPCQSPAGERLEILHRYASHNNSRRTIPAYLTDSEQLPFIELVESLSLESLTTRYIFVDDEEFLE